MAGARGATRWPAAGPLSARTQVFLPLPAVPAHAALESGADGIAAINTITSGDCCPLSSSLLMAQAWAAFNVVAQADRTACSCMLSGRGGESATKVRNAETKSYCCVQSWASTLTPCGLSPVWKATPRPAATLAKQSSPSPLPRWPLLAAGR